MRFLYNPEKKLRWDTFSVKLELQASRIGVNSYPKNVVP